MTIFFEVLINSIDFKTVIQSVPIASIDILVKNNNKYLLGKRINRPAKGYFFSVGGRIMKNEALVDAIARIAHNELNIELLYEPKFIGVYEHFYEDSIFEDVSIHYVNLAYEYEVEQLNKLPCAQHSEYMWFTKKDLLESEIVHKNVKSFFIGSK